jgi:hypothetical protein
MLSDVFKTGKYCHGDEILLIVNVYVSLSSPIFLWSTFPCNAQEDSIQGTGGGKVWMIAKPF